eukprot:8885237-Alexandrium_andersonii.AAC.1
MPLRTCAPHRAEVASALKGPRLLPLALRRRTSCDASPRQRARLQPPSVRRGGGPLPPHLLRNAEPCPREARLAVLVQAPRARPSTAVGGARGARGL